MQARTRNRLTFGIGLALAWQMMLVWSSPTVHDVGWDLGSIRIAAGAMVIITASLALMATAKLRSSRKEQWCAVILILLMVVWTYLAQQPALAALWSMQWLSVLFGVWAIQKASSTSALTVFLGILVLNSVVAIAQLVIQETTFTSAVFNINPHLLSDPGTAKILGPDGAVIRPYGWFVHPNILGAYGVIGCIFSGLLLALPYRWPQKLASEWHLRTIGGITLCASIIMVVLSFSRNAWMAAAAGVASLTIYLGWLHWRKKEAIDRKGLVFGAGVAIATLIVMGICIGPLIMGRVSGSDIEAGGDDHRAQLKEVAHDIIQDHLWLGVGPSQFTVITQAYRPEWSGSQLAPVHHLPRLVLAEWGIIGSLAWAALITGLFYKARVIQGRTALILAVLPPLVVMSWFDMYLYQFWPGMALVGWVMLVVLTFAPNRTLTTGGKPS